MIRFCFSGPTFCVLVVVDNDIETEAEPELIPKEESLRCDDLLLHYSTLTWNSHYPQTLIGIKVNRILLVSG